MLLVGRGRGTQRRKSGCVLRKEQSMATLNAVPCRGGVAAVEPPNKARLTSSAEGRVHREAVSRSQR